MTSETVLLYNIKGTPTAAALKPLLLRLRIRVKIIEPSRYLEPIGSLLGRASAQDSEKEGIPETAFTEPMMVLSGFSNARLDLFLREMRAAKVPSIPLKAVVTSQNQNWNSLRLYKELKAEHAAMHQGEAPSARKD
ncbi:MAG: DUF3783 domain-containing protein [Fusicatenibacter sp.]|nr:DUF3783 domain-containing protein [Fusicatenibacter sp.]